VTGNGRWPGRHSWSHPTRPVAASAAARCLSTGRPPGCQLVVKNERKTQIGSGSVKSEQPRCFAQKDMFAAIAILTIDAEPSNIINFRVCDASFRAPSSLHFGVGRPRGEDGVAGRCYDGGRGRGWWRGRPCSRGTTTSNRTPRSTAGSGAGSEATLQPPKMRRQRCEEAQLRAKLRLAPAQVYTHISRLADLPDKHIRLVVRCVDERF
jgi:hypothetical protein